MIEFFSSLAQYEWPANNVPIGLPILDPPLFVYSELNRKTKIAKRKGSVEM